MPRLCRPLPYSSAYTVGILNKYYTGKACSCHPRTTSYHKTDGSGLWRDKKQNCNDYTPNLFVPWIAMLHFLSFEPRHSSSWMLQFAGGCGMAIRMRRQPYFHVVRKYLMRPYSLSSLSSVWLSHRLIWLLDCILPKHHTHTDSTISYYHFMTVFVWRNCIIHSWINM